jgi:hypothetical protein
MASGGGTGTRTLALGGAVIGAIGIGWFVLSHVILRTGASDAAVEALGVMLALTVVGSVIGAVVGSHRAERRTEDAEDREPGNSVRSPTQRP